MGEKTVKVESFEETLNSLHGTGWIILEGDCEECAVKESIVQDNWR